MDGMIPEPAPRTHAEKAKLWSTVAMWAYVAWIAAEAILPMALHVYVDAHYVVNVGLSVATRGALAAALRSVAILLVDRLAPAAPVSPPRP